MIQCLIFLPRLSLILLPMHATTSTVPNTLLCPPTTRSPVLDDGCHPGMLEPPCSICRCSCLTCIAFDANQTPYPRRLNPLHPTNNSALFTFSTMPSSLHIIALLHLWRRSLSLLPHPCHPLGFGLSHPPPPLCHHRISLKTHGTMVSTNPEP